MVRVVRPLPPKTCRMEEEDRKWKEEQEAWERQMAEEERQREGEQLTPGGRACTLETVAFALVPGTEGTSVPSRCPRPGLRGKREEEERLRMAAEEKRRREQRADVLIINF